MSEQPGHGPPGRDRPDGPALLAIAREVLLRDLAPLLPAERRLDALMVANSMAIAEREAMAGEVAQQAIAQQLERLYQKKVDGKPPTRPSPLDTGENVTRESGEVGTDRELLRRFADDLRRGAFEAAPERERAVRALLWRMTLSRLRLGNPRFLASNGFS